MESAIAVTGDGEIAASEIDEAVADLVEKSLVIADVRGETVYYRLTDTARAYALKKLTEGGEAQAVARRHALHQLDQFECAHSIGAQSPQPSSYPRIPRRSTISATRLTGHLRQAAMLGSE